MKWISVKDRLPTKSSYCLIFVKKKNTWEKWDENVISGYIDSCGEFSDVIDNVTFESKEDFDYWMPLPDPPKE